MNANRPSASAARVLLAKFVPHVESVFALDLRRIATNSGEYERSVNSAGGDPFELRRRARRQINGGYGKKSRRRTCDVTTSAALRDFKLSRFQKLGFTFACAQSRRAFCDNTRGSPEIFIRRDAPRDSLAIMGEQPGISASWVKR